MAKKIVKIKIRGCREELRGVLHRQHKSTRELVIVDIGFVKSHFVHTPTCCTPLRDFLVISFSHRAAAAVLSLMFLG